MKLTVDFETRSKASLPKTGAWVYAEHPSTEIICLALKIDDHPARIWIPEYFAKISSAYLQSRDHSLAEELPMINQKEVLDLVTAADLIEAHNAGFEIAIWEKICRDRLGWPEIPLTKWRCSAAKVAVFALPRALEAAGSALELPIVKDSEGHRVMLKLARPRRPTKNDPAEWNEKPEDLMVLFKYCVNDVEAEHALSSALRDLNAFEQKLWRLDQTINSRGMQVDLKSTHCAIALMERNEERLAAELKNITNEQATSGGQVAKIREWIRTEFKLDFPDLTAATLQNALARDNLPAPVRRVLEIRQSLSMSSTAKYRALLTRASSDGRLRGLLLFHGASTGRWAGVGVQPQNLPRGNFADTDFCIELIKGMDEKTIRLFFGDLMGALSTCIRPMLCAAPGHELICADFSSIEGRILAWLAGERWVLGAYRAGKDMYVINAARTLNLAEEKITPKLRQQYGKPGELACGYQGGANAVRAFGAGEGMTDEEITEKIVKPWREARPNIVRFWNGLQQAAVDAVRNGKRVHYRNLTFAMHRKFLHCRLPSGRILSYFRPEIRRRKMPWGKVRPQLSYMGVDSYTRKWTRQYTYGGKLTENVVQAVARDLMAVAMIKLEAAGYPIVLTIHDEVVSEVPEGFGDLKEYERIMSETPGWAKGLPVSTSGWRGKRYRKD